MSAPDFGMRDFDDLPYGGSFEPVGEPLEPTGAGPEDYPLDITLGPSPEPPAEHQPADDISEYPPSLEPALTEPRTDTWPAASGDIVVSVPDESPQDADRPAAAATEGDGGQARNESDTVASEGGGEDDTNEPQPERLTWTKASERLRTIGYTRHQITLALHALGRLSSHVVGTDGTDFHGYDRNSWQGGPPDVLSEMSITDGRAANTLLLSNIRNNLAALEDKLGPGSFRAVNDLVNPPTEVSEPEDRPST